MRFCQIRSNTRRIYMKYRLNLGFFAEIQKIFAGIWVFFVRIWVSRQNLGFSPVSSSFSGFGGRETETDQPSRFLVKKTCHRLSEQSGWLMSNWFRSGSPGGSSHHLMLLLLLFFLFLKKKIYLYKIEILIQSNLSLYMYETPCQRLKLRPLPSHPTSIYTCKVIITPGVRGDSHHLMLLYQTLEQYLFLGFLNQKKSIIYSISTYCIYCNPNSYLIASSTTFS